MVPPMPVADSTTPWVDAQFAESVAKAYLHSLLAGLALSHRAEGKKKAGRGT